MELVVNNDMIIEEEASWIPLGGTLPVVPQRNIAFGAAAGLVHPATGYSIVNSLKMAGSVADAIAKGIESGDQDGYVDDAWKIIWNDERRRQMGFYQFGMELIESLRLEQLRQFFRTFFALPRNYWTGFLSHRLSSLDLMGFALNTFFVGSNELRFLLVAHLFSSSGSGTRLLETYTYPLRNMHQEDVHLDEDVVRRRSPPQQAASAVSTSEQLSNENAGLLSGFQTREWWYVGGQNMQANRAPGKRNPGMLWRKQGESSMLVSTNTQSASMSSSEAYVAERLPGDFGWDPLALGAGRDLEKFRESELLHGRWAMMAAVGVILPDALSLGGIFGEHGYHWWNAGIEFIDGEPALFYLGERVPLNLIPVAAVHFPLIALAELLRDGKLQIPGLKGLDRMYPGGPAFDPLGLAKKTGDDAQELKTLELAGSRVAMVSVFVFVIEAVFLRRGPVEALLY